MRAGIRWLPDGNSTTNLGMAGWGAGLVSCSEAREGADEAAAWFIDGDSIAAIGFVEGVTDRSAEASSRVDEALAALGAPRTRPRRSFDDEDDFVTALGDRQHRGALALVSPRLWLSAEGSPSRVDYGILDPRLGAGYVPGPDGEPEHNAPPAVDTVRHRVRFGDDHVAVEHWQRFALHNPLDLDGRYDPDSPPPCGFLSVSYRLFVDGRGEAALSASYLPSSWFYLDWMRCHRRDMRRATRDEIDRVLSPRRERPAGTTSTTIPVGRGMVHAQREEAR